MAKGITKKNQRNTSLRHNEYYDMQDMLDKLHSDSKSGKNFTELMGLIMSEQNLLMAYRNIKANQGSKTPGVDGKNILEIAQMEPEKYIKVMRDKLRNYNPQPVRRTLIPKDNGKTRPLGIPTMKDRLVQQAIKQIIEPIVEAKLYQHSYGFRPNRGTNHAIARAVSLVNMNKLYYVVDIDIKGFFDNVNHAKLLKQMWSLGIRDKNLLAIISKMLKAEIKGIGKPDKGTPQGGILSPLLSNIVLNELDWWIAKQWENFEARNLKVKQKVGSNGKIINDRSSQYSTLKGHSNLKEMFIVRYADDFKIFCRSHSTAKKVFHATESWLNDRLGLEISPEKSKVTNLRRNSTEFLGYQLKAERKNTTRGDYVAQTNLTDKASERIAKEMKKRLKQVRRTNDIKDVMAYNAFVLGVHQYYKYATKVAPDFYGIWTEILRTYIKTGKMVGKRKIGKGSKVIDKYYKDYMGALHIYSVQNVTLYPPYGIRHTNPMNFSQTVSNYTPEGRILRHTKLKGDITAGIRYILKSIPPKETVQYADLRVSVYSKQKGKCAVTGRVLEPWNMELHHIMPRALGGEDKITNLAYISREVHKVIHMTDLSKIHNIIKLNQLSNFVEKINNLRLKAGNVVIGTL